MKEVFATDHAQVTTGDAHWATSTKVWFVMIKDDKGRYPGNPLWGARRFAEEVTSVGIPYNSPKGLAGF